MSPLLLDLDRLTRWYGPLHALREVTLSLPPGRIGLLGPNGAGKSTLLKILLGLLPPSSGSGRLLGRDIATAGADLRRTIGYMPEADGLIPGMSGVDYVGLAGELYGMPRREARRRAHEVLTYLDLEEARYRMLEGYSLGMKQRLKLAAALIHDPPVLLLDEPTSGLDPSGRDSMLDLLRTLGQEYGKSIILCTHLLGDVERVCETVLILDQGRVIRQGSVAELCSQRLDRFRLQADGDLHAFREQLRRSGVGVQEGAARGRMRVTVPAEWTSRDFFTHAGNAGATLTGLERDDETLEELFHRVLDEAGRPGRAISPVLGESAVGRDDALEEALIPNPSPLSTGATGAIR